MKYSEFTDFSELPNEDSNTWYSSFKKAVKAELDVKLNMNEAMHGYAHNDDGTLLAYNVKKPAVNPDKIIKSQFFSYNYKYYTVQLHPDHLDKYLNEVSNGPLLHNGVHLFASNMHIETTKTKYWDSVEPSGKITHNEKTVPHHLYDQTIYVGFFKLDEYHFEVLDDGYVELILENATGLVSSNSYHAYTKYLELKKNVN